MGMLYWGMYGIEVGLLPARGIHLPDSLILPLITVHSSGKHPVRRPRL